MKRETLWALGCGLVFGLGLEVSGMTSPQKVQAFLDLGGAWDPSLALVMGGAVLAALPWFRRVQLPAPRRIDGALVVGSALFGVGWGLSGTCPGPGIVNAATGAAGALAFVGCMLFGMSAHSVWRRARRARLGSDDAAQAGSA